MHKNEGCKIVRKGGLFSGKSRFTIRLRKRIRNKTPDFSLVWKKNRENVRSKQRFFTKQRNTGPAKRNPGSLSCENHGKPGENRKEATV